MSATAPAFLRYASPVTAPAAQIDIVVPVHNEAAALELSLRRLHRFLSAEFPFSWRIVPSPYLPAVRAPDHPRTIAARGPLHLHRLRHPVRANHGTSGRVPHLHRPAAVHPARWATVDDPHAADRGPPQRHPARARPHRHRHDAALRHRPARAARPVRRQQHPVGLRHPPRRRDRGSRTKPRGPHRHRHLPPALLLGHGRVGAPLRLPDPSAQAGRRVDHAARRRDRVVGRRDARPRATASR